MRVDRGPQRRFRFRLAAEFDKHVSQIVKCRGIVGKELNRLLIGFFRFGDLAVFAQGISKAVIGETELRVDRQRVFISANRFSYLPACAQSGTKVCVHSGIVRSKRRGALELRDRFVLPVLPFGKFYQVG